MRFIFVLSVFLMAAGLGAESLAAKFKQGGALGTYRDKWLLLSAANVEAEDQLAKKFGIPLIRAILGEALNMADILGSWFRNGRSKVNTALSGKGHEVEGVLVFKAGKMERFGSTTRYIAFGSRPERSVEGEYITERPPSAAASSSSSSTFSMSSSGSSASGAARTSPPTAVLLPGCMQVAVSMEKPPGTCFAGSGANELELRRSL